MANIIYRTEASRGCGFRKDGGLYMVSDGEPIPCSLLPANVPDKIKTTRSYTWVTAEIVQYIEIKDSQGKKTKVRRGCSNKSCSCWINAIDKETPCLLDWVGMGFYRTTKHFLQESSRQGISRRIPRIPKGFKVGETIVFLAHREASNTVDLESGELKPIRQIFAAFVPKRIEYIVKDGDTEDFLNDLEGKGVTLVKIKRSGDQLDLGFQAN